MIFMSFHYRTAGSGDTQLYWCLRIFVNQTPEGGVIDHLGSVSGVCGLWTNESFVIKNMQSLVNAGLVLFSLPSLGGSNTHPPSLFYWQCSWLLFWWLALGNGTNNNRILVYLVPGIPGIEPISHTGSWLYCQLFFFWAKLYSSFHGSSFPLILSA